MVFGKKSGGAGKWVAIVCVAVVVVLLIVLAIANKNNTGTTPQENEEPMATLETISSETSGKQHMAIEVPTALAGAAKPGNVVCIYGADGKVIPALQSVQISAVGKDSLLLLVDDYQASILAAAEGVQVVLLELDKQGIADALAAQEEANTPTGTLTVTESLELAQGEEMQLEWLYTVEPEGAAVPDAVFSSNHPEIAEVDESGVITAVSMGVANVTVSVGDQSAVCVVTVTVPVQAIHLNPEMAAIGVGETCTFTVTPEPENATAFHPAFESRNPEVAVIGSDGTVTGIAPGTAEILVRAGDVQAVFSVSVGNHAQSLLLDKDTLSLAVGKTAVLTATVEPEDHLEEIVWETGDPAVATVDADGTVTAVAPGTTQILCTCGSVSMPCTITVY